MAHKAKVAKKEKKVIAKVEDIKTKAKVAKKEKKVIANVEEIKIEPLEVSHRIEEPEVVIKEQKLYKKIKGGFRCKICNYECPHLYKIQRHLKCKHGPGDQFACEHCGKIYRSKYMCQLHTLQHLENASDFLYCCDKCEYRVANKHYLKVHMARKHCDEAKFECATCGRCFKVKTDLKFHLGTHDEMQHMCDTCGRMYTSKESLNKHRRVQHINDYKFKCEICYVKLLTRESFENHMVKHHQQLYRCEECDVKFVKKHYLTRHQKRVHSSARRHACTVCKKAFMCKTTLRVHYLTHAKIKPYQCTVCRSTFTQRSSMMLHWRKKHPEETEPPPPVMLTNFYESLETQVNEHVRNGRHLTKETPTEPDRPSVQ